MSSKSPNLDEPLSSIKSVLGRHGTSIPVGWDAEDEAAYQEEMKRLEHACLLAEAVLLIRNYVRPTKPERLQHDPVENLQCPAIPAVASAVRSENTRLSSGP